MSQLPTKPGKQRGAPWVVLLVGLVVLYVLSSGPMLAISFKLRDLTGWNGFYGVMWLYYPLLARAISRHRLDRLHRHLWPRNLGPGLEFQPGNTGVA